VRCSSRSTVHGLRRTFNDLARRAGRTAVAGVVRLVPLSSSVSRSGSTVRSKTVDSTVDEDLDREKSAATHR
jgi:hypothetical protein